MRQTNHKNKIIKFRVTESDGLLIKRLADESDKTVSEYIREIVAYGCRFRVEPREVKEELLALRRDLNSGVGNNINQLALYANSGRGTPSYADFQRLADDFQATRQRINLSLALFDGPMLELLNELEG